MESHTPDWDEFLGACVVVDTNSPFVYIGSLKRITEDILFMEDADVHDRQEGASSNEIYILNARKHGVKPNRKKVSIHRRWVISLSRLTDVIDY